MPEQLLPREEQVLKIIIEDYIAKAMPVGSRTVAKKSELKLSPASMRNVMSDLTDKGYLEQPHTSAGRIPTVRAFRHYLDSAFMPLQLTEERKSAISQQLQQAGLELSDVLGQASKLVSNLSNQVSLVLAPRHEDVRWREIDFALVKPGLVLAVLILDGGIVQNKLLPVEEDVTKDELDKFRNYLNEHYKGLTLSEARRRIVSELENAKRRLKMLYRRALRLARTTFDENPLREVYVDGTLNILEHAEFADVGKMREILRLLEERTRLLTILDKTITGEGIKIMLGQEAELDDLQGCSVVCSAYGDEIRPLGVVSVIGPLRMDYARVIPVVDYISQALTGMIKERF